MRKESQVVLEAFNASIATLHENGFIKGVLKSYGLDPSAGDTGEPRRLE